MMFSSFGWTPDLLRDWDNIPLLVGLSGDAVYVITIILALYQTLSRHYCKDSLFVGPFVPFPS
jgi:hypothetical protein